MFFPGPAARVVHGARQLAFVLPLVVAGCEVPNPAFNVQALREDAARDSPNSQVDGTPGDKDAGPRDAARDLPGMVEQPHDAETTNDVPNDALTSDGGGSGGHDARPGDAALNTPPGGVLPTLLDGLVAYWPLDEGDGNRAADRIGNNHGRLEHREPASAWRTGYIGHAVAFDPASGAAIEIAPTSALNRIQTAFTIAAWVFPRAHDAIISVFSRQLGDGTAEQYDLALLRNHGRFYTFDSNLNTHAVLIGTRRVPDEVWSHLAVTYDGTVARLYVNGALDGTLITRAHLQSDGKPAFIGTNINMGTYDRRETFHGLIDEVVLYARALLPEEIATLAALKQSLR